jgi:hypothetical protein
MKLAAIVIASGLAACGDPFVGTWTLEQHLSGPPVTDCPTTAMTMRTVKVSSTSTANQYTIDTGDQQPASQWMLDPDGKLQFDGMVPTTRADVGSAHYALAPGGNGLIGSATWWYLVSGTPSAPPTSCPILDVRSL